MKRFALAVLSYCALSMALAYPWHMVWFHDFYLGAGAMTRPDPIIPLGLLSMAAQGAVIAYLYPLAYRGGRPVLAGIRFSLLIGVVVFSVMGPATAAKFAIEPVGAFLVHAGAFQFLQFALAGAALGLIYGRAPSGATGLEGARHAV